MVKIVGQIGKLLKGGKVKSADVPKEKVESKALPAAEYPKFKIHFNLVIGQKTTPDVVEIGGVTEAEAFTQARLFFETKYKKEIEELGAVVTYSGKFSIIKKKE